MSLHYRGLWLHLVIGKKSLLGDEPESERHGENHVPQTESAYGAAE